MRKINNFLRKLPGRRTVMLATASVMLSAGLLRGQTNIANYQFAKGTETYTPITGGTVLVAANVTYDQEISAAVTIPAMTFGGASVNTVYVHANGYLTFGAAHSTTTYTPLSTSGTNVTGVVSAFGADLGYSAGNATTGATSEIRYQQIGDEFIAQYADIKRWNVANERVSFQIRVNSTTGVIKIIYGGTIVVGSSTTGLHVGIRGNSTTWTTNVNNLMIDNIPAGTTCDWSNAVTANANSAALYTTSANTAVAPVANLSYTWTPATAVAPVRALAAVAGITANGATISWTAPTGATQYNVQYRTPETCAWTNFSGNPVTGTTANLTGLTQTTTYQVRVMSSDGTNNAIWSHIPNAAGSGNGYSTSGTFTTLASCGIPVSVAVPAASINSTTATVNWTAPTIGPPTGYRWEVRTSGAAGSGATGLVTTGTGTATTANLTSLTSATTYSVYVRTICGASDSSNWSSAVAFTTLCTTPAPGATIASVSSNLCTGSTVVFSLTTATPGPGVTYQWQSSTNNVSYTNISGATSATYSGPATAFYYRCMVKCAAGPDSTASTPVQLTYVNNVTGTTPAQRCGVGTVNLAATGSAGSVLKWYAATTGGAALGTGPSFTTPSINATTSYYVGAENVSANSIPVGNGASTGTSVAYNLTQGGYGGMKGQYLFTATELQNAGLSAGNITALSIEITSAGSALNGFNIQMGTTALTDFVTPVNIQTTASQVYSAATFTPVVGINTFTLTTPFNWDGTSNIIVSTSWSNNNSSNTSSTVKYDATTNYASQSYRKDNETAPNMLAFTGATGTGTNTFDRSQNRPKMIFNGQGICSSPRIAVAATVNTPPAFTLSPNKTICNGSITPLTVTSNTANFNTYTWSPSTNLYTDPAATIAYTAGNSATTVYLKSTTPGSVVYTVNANNTTSLCAAVATDTLIVLPASVTAVATPASICVSGTTTLALTPSAGYGAAIFKWQSGTDNISFGDEGANSTSSTYTTPTLTSTKYYRVTIKNSDSVLCLNSASDTAKVYNPVISSTTPGSRCGPGTVTLGGTVTEGTLNWYSASTGGNLLGSGLTFTTPSISANTTYYASAAAGGTSGTATIGSGALTSITGTPDFSAISPYAYHYGNYKHQMLITAAELNAAGISAGNITSLAFDVATAGSPVAAFNNFNITLIPTSQTAMTATFATGGTGVYSAASVTPTVGINTYNFSTPFPWDGVANIIIQTCYNNNNSGAVASSAEVRYDNTSYVSHTIYRADGTQNTVCAQTTGNTSNDGPIISKRPKIALGYNSSCESPRVAVLATINATPTAGISPAGPVQICAGATTTLTGSGGNNYQWRNASGNIGGQTNSTLTTGTTGTYRVVAIAANGCTDTSAAVTVNVNALPVVNLGNDTVFCSGNTLNLNAANSGAAFLWDNASTNQTRNVNTSGTYYVKVTNTANCSKSDTINVTVNPTPVVNLGNDTTLCQGANLVLNAGNPGAAKLWDNATTAQTRTVSNTGTYYVRVTNNFNCVARDTLHATFLPSPTVNLGNDIEICAGSNVTLDAGNPGETYLWDNNSTQQTRTVSASGNYFVTVRNIANCTGSDTVKVIIHPLPVVNLGNDTAFCHDNSLTLDAGNPGASYHWSDNSAAQTLVVTATGNYGVTVTDIYSCVGSDNINILVKDLPSGIINAVHGDTATYTFNVLEPEYVTGYTWNFGDGTPLVTGPMVQHRYANNGVYMVSVMLAGECADSVASSRTVDVYDATGGTGIPRITDSKDLVLYPNPAKDVVTLENKRGLDMKQITVYNVVGQVIYNAVADSKEKHKLNTAGFRSGIYTIRIETDKGYVIRKFEILK